MILTHLEKVSLLKTAHARKFEIEVQCAVTDCFWNTVPAEFQLKMQISQEIERKKRRIYNILYVETISCSSFS